MREIKFRVWNSGKMLTGITLASMFYEGLSGEAKGFRYNGMPLMQYTGLKDKNGKEIYEGDIVECSTGDEMNVMDGVVGEVTYAPPAFEVSWEDPVFGDMECSPLNDRWVVMGNIYENAGLLEDTK